MAMNKKEQAYVEGLLTAGALRYTSDVVALVRLQEGSCSMGNAVTAPEYKR
jgi:hypothetical protein